ncbi:methylglyoxal synthase [Rhodovibrionaceae bacterium A322]
MPSKRIALVAHDGKKAEMLAWVKTHEAVLKTHRLWGTGTTGGQVSEATDLSVTRLKSGPLGGDQQLGAMIAEGKLDALFFFVDPLSTQPHDVDVKALVRLSTLYNVLLACNPATASCLITSPDF